MVWVYKDSKGVPWVPHHMDDLAPEITIDTDMARVQVLVRGVVLVKDWVTISEGSR